MVINTMGWIEGLGYELLLHAIRTLQVGGEAVTTGWAVVRPVRGSRGVAQPMAGCCCMCLVDFVPAGLAGCSLFSRTDPWGTLHCFWLLTPLGLLLLLPHVLLLHLLLLLPLPPPPFPPLPPPAVHLATGGCGAGHGAGPAVQPTQQRTAGGQGQGAGTWVWAQQDRGGGAVCCCHTTGLLCLSPALEEHTRVHVQTGRGALPGGRRLRLHMPCSLTLLAVLPQPRGTRSPSTSVHTLFLLPLLVPPSPCSLSHALVPDPIDPPPPPTPPLTHPHAPSPPQAPWVPPCAW
jgi:hypothetical protein